MGFDIKKKNNNSSLASNGARESAKQYQNKNSKIRQKKEEDYFNKSFNYRNFIFAPEGFEEVMVGIYILLLPYLMGLLFLYLFIAEGNFEFFVEFNLVSFFVIWAIGYEVIAGLIMLFIVLGAIRYYSKKGNKDPKNKRRDRF